MLKKYLIKKSKKSHKILKNSDIFKKKYLKKKKYGVY